MWKSLILLVRLFTCDSLTCFNTINALPPTVPWVLVRFTTDFGSDQSITRLGTSCHSAIIIRQDESLKVQVIFYPLRQLLFSSIHPFFLGNGLLYSPKVLLFPLFLFSYIAFPVCISSIFTWHHRFQCICCVVRASMKLLMLLLSQIKLFSWSNCIACF